MKSKRPQKKTRREKKRFKKKTIIFLSSIVIIIGSFFYVMNNEYLAIQEVHIQGQKTIIQSDIESTIHDYLSGNIGGVIRRDNILLLNTQKITKLLKNTFPKIQELSVEIDEADILNIIIGERSAHSLWCINREYESVFDEECYFSDNKGLLYARAPYFSGNVYMKIFIEPYEDDVYIGTQVQTIESFDQFFIFLSDLEKDYPLSISSVVFKEFNDVAIRLSRVHNQIYDTARPVILYNQSHKYDIILRDIGIIIDFDSFKKDFKSSPRRLASIDVRFENRALYTFVPIDSESE